MQVKKQHIFQNFSLIKFFNLNDSYFLVNVSIPSDLLSYFTLDIIGSIFCKKTTKNDFEENEFRVHFFTSKDPIMLNVICINYIPIWAGSRAASS